MSAIERVRRRLEHGARDPEVQLEELILDINEQIVERMQASGLRRSDLADRLGTSRAFVTKLLDGHENLTLKTLARVANALEMKVDLRLRPRERRAESPKRRAPLPRTRMAAPRQTGTRAVAARTKTDGESARISRRSSPRGAKRASERAR